MFEGANYDYYSATSGSWIVVISVVVIGIVVIGIVGEWPSRSSATTKIKGPALSRLVAQ